LVVECARGCPGLLRSAILAVRRIGDVMFDGVIPLGEACCGRSFFLGRPPGVGVGSRASGAGRIASV
jgi:hypothetical protein